MEKRQNYQKIYSDYRRPRFSPPAYIFGIVWPILYILIIISYGIVVSKLMNGEISWIILIPFIINIVANLSYTYFQFKLQNFFLALIDILIVLITIIITMIVIWPYSHLVVYLQIPYLCWVSFAPYLQISIFTLNRKS